MHVIISFRAISFVKQVQVILTKTNWEKKNRLSFFMIDFINFYNSIL
jgi:hypothetical protein